MAIQIWEYKEEKLYFKGPIIFILDELGKQGWELCVFLNDNHGTAYFKRLKQKR